MKTISSIICVILCTISLPIGIVQIIEQNRPFLFLILCIMMLPGYITALKFLYKKYDW